MGLFYDEGLEGACEPNMDLSLEYYCRAEQHLPESMHNIGKTYEDSRSVATTPADSGTAMRVAVCLYSIASARGFPLSQVNLGRLFLLGEESVRRDPAAGRRLLLMLAAESGDCDAQMVVGVIHATPAFECLDLLLAEYWLQAARVGGKLDVDEHLARVREQMRAEGLASLPADRALTSLSAEAARQRGDDYKHHGLLEAAALEYSKAYTLFTARLLTAPAAGQSLDELCAAHTAMIAVVFDRLEVVLRVRRFEDVVVDCLEILRRSIPFTEYLQSTREHLRAGNKAVEDTMRGELRRCRIVVDEDLSKVLFGALTQALVELNWQSEFTSFWTAYNSLSSEHLQAVLALVVEGVLECGEYGARCLALLAKVSARGKQVCAAVFGQGALPVVVAAISSVLAPGCKVLPGSASTALSYLCCNGCVLVANLLRYLPARLSTEVLLASDGLLMLIRLTCSGWEAVVGEAVPAACYVNCSREGVQALANLAVIATDRVWRELLSSKCVTAFSAVVTGALLDLNKVIPQGGGQARSKLRTSEGLSDSEAEARWQDSFTTLEVGVAALARVMEVCPVAFSKELSGTPLMQQLQKIFKMDVLSSSLRTNTAFILYSMTCAKDADASRLLQDGVTRRAIKDILQEHELTLNPGGERYPWSLEQLFAYVSRGLVAWAGSMGQAGGGRKGSGDCSHLVVTCSARIPQLSTDRHAREHAPSIDRALAGLALSV